MKELNLILTKTGDYRLYIFIPTEEIYVTCIKKLHEEGYVWNGGKDMLSDYKTPPYGECTFLSINPDKKVTYGSINTASIYFRNPQCCMSYQDFLGPDTEELYEELLQSISSLEEQLGGRDEGS